MRAGAGVVRLRSGWRAGRVITAFWAGCRNGRTPSRGTRIRLSRSRPARASGGRRRARADGKGEERRLFAGYRLPPRRPRPSGGGPPRRATSWPTPLDARSAPVCAPAGSAAACLPAPGGVLRHSPPATANHRTFGRTGKVTESFSLRQWWHQDRCPRTSLQTYRFVLQMCHRCVLPDGRRPADSR